MSLSRDRLARPIDISTLIPHAARRVGLFVDEPGLHRGLGVAPVGAEGLDSRPVGTGISGIATAGRGRGWNYGRSPFRRGNFRQLRRVPPRGWVAGSGLRSWYPRTPLRDITAVARAIERRRAREASESEAETDNNEGTSDSDLIHNSGRRTTVLRIRDENAAPSFQPENDISFKTPLPASFAKKPQRTPASRALSIVASIAREKPSDFLTPEKKLLGSIEKVREALKEDEQRMKDTPAAKKAEREKKMRILMSMR